MHTWLVPSFLVVRAPNDDVARARTRDLQDLALKNGYVMYQDQFLAPIAVDPNHQFHSLLDYFEVPEGVQQ